MDQIIEKAKGIFNSLLEIIKTWEIGDFIFIGVDILIVIIIICLISKRIRKNKKLKKEQKLQKELEKETLEVLEEEKEISNDKKVVEEAIEAPIEEVEEEKEEEKTTEKEEVEVIKEPVIKKERKTSTNATSNKNKQTKKATSNKKEKVRPEKVEKLIASKVEEPKEVYDNTVPFEKVTISLPNKVNYRLGKGWESLFRRAKRNIDFKEKIWPFVYNSYLENKKVTPEKDNLFKPFEYCDPSHVKVVFINKQPGLTLEDDGLAFSTSEKGRKTLMFSELYNEAKRDRNIRAIRYDDGSLKRYARQGVFLYNYILTNAVGESRKHETLGWEVFSNMVVKDLAKDPTPKVFVLFGSYVTNQVSEIITKNSNHKIIVVPSMQKINGSNLFSEINEYLVANKINPINWSLGKIRK